MKIELAPAEYPIGHDGGFSPNSTVFFLISFENTMDAVTNYPFIKEWCEANCRSYWSLYPLHDPKWNTVLTQGLVGFTDPSEAMLFRLHH